LNADKSGFALDMGLELLGKSEFDPDYIVPTGAAPTPTVRGPFVIHGGATNVKAAEGYETLAGRRDTYFNRRWDHFCSHQHTPDSSDSPYPAAVTNGNVAYLAHSIFTAYRQLGQPLYRDLFSDVLKTLLPRPSVETNLPSAGRSSLMSQENQQRSILHLLFAVPQKRGADSTVWASSQASVEIIEDLYPLRDIECLIRTSQPVQGVKLVPSEQTLDFTQEEGGVRFTVPELLCHAMVELTH
jgi:hypothetical protein